MTAIEAMHRVGVLHCGIPALSNRLSLEDYGEIRRRLTAEVRLIEKELGEVFSWGRVRPRGWALPWLG